MTKKKRRTKHHPTSESKQPKNDDTVQDEQSEPYIHPIYNEILVSSCLTSSPTPPYSYKKQKRSHNGFNTFPFSTAQSLSSFESFPTAQPVLHWLGSVPTFDWDVYSAGKASTTDIISSSTSAAAAAAAAINKITRNITSSTSSREMIGIASGYDATPSALQNNGIVSTDHDATNEIKSRPWDIASWNCTKGKNRHTECNHQSHVILSLLQHLGHVKEHLGSYSKSVSDIKRSILGIETTPENEFRRASRNAQVNPFESLSFMEFDQGVPLISRSALKLANIDALVDFCLCRCSCCTPKSSLLPLDHAFLFVDLCGAPGGFSQYLLFRAKQMQIQKYGGYGMSLVGKNVDSVGVEWDQEYSWTTTHDGKDDRKFQVHLGTDGTGDIYCWDNVLSLRDKICKDWNRPRVDLVVADGGLDAQRDCPNQEEVAMKLVVCQVAAALLLLDRGGNLVVKMFGFQSVPIRHLMESLAMQFDTVKVVKPVASRPASAERYVVALGYQRNSDWNDDDALFLKWRDDILLTDSITDHVIQKDHHHLCQEEASKVREKNASSASSALYRMLDWVDCDIATLNINACENILKCLKLQQSRFSNSHGKRNRSKKTNQYEKANIDTEWIRQMWRL